MDLFLIIQKNKLLKWHVLIITFFLLGTCRPYHPVSIQQGGIPIAGLVKIKPDKNQNKSFRELRCTEEDKEAITYIITCMGQKENKRIQLWGLKSELEKKGEEIAGVHPLKFLSIVFQDEYLKKVCMPEIFDVNFKKNGFLKRGFEDNMDTEAKRGKLQEYLEDFMKEIHLKPSHYDALMEFVKEKNWEGFILYLIEH